VIVKEGGIPVAQLHPGLEAAAISFSRREDALDSVKSQGMTDEIN
jgi:hypothetical protein